MSENGEKKADVGEVVRSILANLEKDESGLLLDMETDYPCLRSLLLGGKPGSGKAPSACLSISRGPSGVVLRLAIVPLGVVAEYDCTSFFGTLEVIELGLDAKRVDWRPDWRRSKKERSAWDGVV